MLVVADDDGGRGVEKHVLEGGTDCIWQTSASAVESGPPINPPTKFRIFFLQALAALSTKLLSEVTVAPVYDSHIFKIDIIHGTTSGTPCECVETAVHVGDSYPGNGGVGGRSVRGRQSGRVPEARGGRIEVGRLPCAIVVSIRTGGGLLTASSG